MALPTTLQKSLTATASIAVAELFSEGQSAANDPDEFPFAEISERLDGRTCPLCQAVDGMILKVGSPEYHQWRQPSHINCRRVMVYISKDEAGVEADFEAPDVDLIRKHGHYHTQPDKYAELRVPAEPAGRHFVVRRVKHPETGEVRTVLDWAPWHDQLPKAKRELVLKARATTDEGELTEILGKLGVANRDDPEQLRQATLLGLRDRIEGWHENFPGPPWTNPNQPDREPARSHPEAEGWALANIPGLQHADYSRMDLEVANEINRVVSDITTKFGIQVPAIAPRDSSHWTSPRTPGAAMSANSEGLAYDPDLFLGPALAHTKDHLERKGRKQNAEASVTIAGLIAHEAGHLLILNHPVGHSQASVIMASKINRYRGVGLPVEEQLKLGNRQAWVREELGDYAWNGGFQETWAEAFSAYWDAMYSCSEDTKRVVIDVLRALFPNVEL